MTFAHAPVVALVLALAAAGCSSGDSGTPVAVNPSAASAPASSTPSSTPSPAGPSSDEVQAQTAAQAAEAKKKADEERAAERRAKRAAERRAAERRAAERRKAERRAAERRATERRAAERRAAERRATERRAAERRAARVVRGNGISLAALRSRAASEWRAAYGTRVSRVTCSGDGGRGISRLPVGGTFSCEVHAVNGMFTQGFGQVTGRPPYFTFTLLTD